MRPRTTFEAANKDTTPCPHPTASAPDNPSDGALHDKMVMLVERMLDLNKKKAAEKTPNILDQIETQISGTGKAF